ncbi:MAG: 3'-5' exonuclease [Acetatifactor sp.]|nr:3'-5' exonuclease [Acetatifactor sp.]
MTDSYVSIDLETTGLNPKRDKITEIGAVKVINGVVTERFSSLINPGRPQPEYVANMTGIKDAELMDAPYIEEVFPKLIEFLEDLPLLGHSIIFDYSFLKKEAVNEKIKFEKRGIDTLKIARKYLPELEHRSLGFLCELYGIPLNAHRAMEDAYATHLLYLKLSEKFDGSEEKLFLPGPLIFNVKRDVPATTLQKERLIKLYAKHHLKMDFDIERISRSEASRMTDIIFSRYGRNV